ncbi:methylmalonyl-CoA mutase [Formosa agariphila KMM 3901]|uniref:Methylmalonyl-CoA mutase n=1 Tax=Formosa agariphila (strain DSM 15362 / KCTC 12365 / LMG 23005 / KMM 3901 / M-2Alg 35-1) TaxID=1347342 RepID=T2KPN4_FORAG|nr:hypothetical protein [Formosa agariphila]CDF79949.1 methylmalonyl-CoA mutase [Formosa agariphila KMM 3901]
MKRPSTSDNHLNNKAKLLVDTFAEQEGRRPRILLSNIEDEQHEHDVKIIASAYADLGFDVDLAPVFHSSQDLSKQAIENDVSALYLTSISKKSLPQILEIIVSLTNYGSEYILLVVDGTSITEDESALLSSSGVHIILNETMLVPEVAIRILNYLVA